METPNFLAEKYPDLPGSKPVERAVKRSAKDGKLEPQTRGGRVEAYTNRLERVLSKRERGSESARRLDPEKGFHLLKNKILARFTLETDPETIERTARALYESEKKITIERGQGADVQHLESVDENIVEKYKPLVLEKAQIQRETLSEWLDYLQQNDAKHPMWFRYFVIRSLEKMGSLDKEKKTYSKRAKGTIAPFPELNSEALGWVYNRLKEAYTEQEPPTFMVGDEEDEGTLAQEIADEDAVVSVPPRSLERLIAKKDFASLYATAQIEVAADANRESIDGEWRKYDKGSDFTVLERDLKGKGTGWCTAEGSAQNHLQGGDFYVYYSKTNSGYTQPRVAIRMEGDNVAEVRGIDQRQELESELTDIAQAKYHNLPGGDMYDKKAADVKKLAEIYEKASTSHLSKEELIFLYEINAPIESFGNVKHPRVAELRSTRNPEEDMLTIFECDESQIARSPADVTKDTKAYVGKLEPGIFDKVAEFNIEHVYTSFPEGRIRRFSLEIGGKDERELEELLKQNGHRFDYVGGLLEHDDFKRSLREEDQKQPDWKKWKLKSPEHLNLVRLTVADLGFPSGAKFQEIIDRAIELGLDLCPLAFGPHYRLQYTDQPMNEWVSIGMKPISGPDGDARVSAVLRDVGSSWLVDHWADSHAFWDADHKIVFRLRKYARP